MINFIKGTSAETYSSCVNKRRRALTFIKYSSVPYAAAGAGPDPELGSGPYSFGPAVPGSPEKQVKTTTAISQTRHISLKIKSSEPDIPDGLKAPSRETTSRIAVGIV